MDRISKLPTGIIETILCLLPIQEAARTSILSREWRYHWIKIPKLAFIEDTFQESTYGAELSVLEQTFDKPSQRKEMTHSLTTLNLQEIETTEKGLMRLLSSCPLLKRLTIMSDGGLIYYTGDFTIAEFFECLPVIEYLFVVFFIFMCFVPNRLPKELPTSLVHLKYLRMESVWFRHKYAVPFFILLIRSSPNLEKLKLEIYVDDLFDESETCTFTLEDYSDIMFEHLKDLEILHFTNDDNELAVVKLILAKSPVLKNVRILLWDEFDEDEKFETSKILLSFQCASLVVNIIVS